MIEKIKNRMIFFLENKYFPFVFSFILLIPSLIWIFLDNHVWPWDQAWYGEVSVDLYYKLTHSISLWPKAMATAFGIKAPAIAWIGQFFVPFAKITGSIDRALLLSVVLAQFLSLLFIYKIVLSLTNRKTIAILGNLIMASAPLFIGVGHQYFVESLQLFIIILIIFIFINLDSWNIYDSIIASATAFAFAMLIKITSPLYILLLVPIGAVYLIKFTKKDSIKEYFKKKSNIILYIFGLIFIVAVIFWYAVNWNSIFQFMKLASSGSAAELYGSKASFFNKFNLWLLFFRKSFFVLITTYISLALVVFSVGYILRTKNKIVMKKSISMFWISLGSIFLTLIFFSFQINEETRYLLPLLPYIVIIICLALDWLKSDFAVGFFASIFFAQYVFVNGIALGIINNTSQEISSWVTQKKSNGDDLGNIKIILEQTCVKESEYKINMVGVEFPWLNANSVEYYAMQNKLKTDRQCYYTSLGYTENNMENAWTRLQSINPPFFIISSDKITQNLEAFNGVSLQALKRITADANFAPQNVPQLSTIKIFKNILIKK